MGSLTACLRICHDELFPWQNDDGADLESEGEYEPFQREVTMNSRGLAVVFVGVAWSFLGLGFMAIHFRYLPKGAELVGLATGLFLAGIASGVVFLAFRTGLTTTSTRALLVAGYLLLVPIGLMAGLLAPTTLVDLGAASGTALVLVVPFLVTLYSSLAMASGMLSVAGMGLFLQKVAAWRQPRSEPIPVEVRLRR